MSDMYPSAEMARARRAIDGMRGVSHIGAWQKRDSSGKWSLELRLTHDAAPTSSVPEVTGWVIEVDPSFPLGEVRFFPASNGSVEATFQHQRYNGVSVQWRRDGEICLSDTPDRIAHGINDEPLDYTRLPWRVSRALEWLGDASRGTLAKNGDWFELPDFPGADVSAATFAFAEESGFDAHANGSSPRGGIATVLMRDPAGPYLLKSLTPLRGSTNPDSVEWGALERSSKIDHGFWIRLENIPVFAPWQPPVTFGELAECVKRDGIDLLGTLCKVAKENRRELFDGRPHLLLVGFPVPRKIGQGPERIHWQAIVLPSLQFEKRGFRSPARTQVCEHVRQVLRPELRLEWIRSENWADDLLTSRGAMPANVARTPIAIIGCGALGSAIAELLVRAGCRDLVLFDDDLFRAGNAVRHTLTLASVGCSKAESLAARLSLISPRARIEGYRVAFPNVPGKALARLRKAQLLIDTTGNDQVLRALAAFEHADSTNVVSVSIGYRAKRLFFYSALCSRFSASDFSERIQPWLQEEREESAKDEFPRDGLGCWHPAFPARADDIWLAAVTAVKLIESSAAGDQSQFLVLEQPSHPARIGFSPSQEPRTPTAHE